MPVGAEVNVFLIPLLHTKLASLRLDLKRATDPWSLAPSLPLNGTVSVLKPDNVTKGMQTFESKIMVELQIHEVLLNLLGNYNGLFKSQDLDGCGNRDQDAFGGKQPE